MSNKTNAGAEETKAPETTKASAPEYSIEELAAAASIFGVTPDCVTAALRSAKLTKATKKQAKDLVEKFAKAEVPDTQKKEGK